ncbi:phage protein NinX family protein [Pseudomonas putida]|uniref:phage protein NinX family protein n=1 Tax=Pseudomonas putida TaxID=303 RepID=UPI00041EBCE3|nr:phage protein NinX family protein [Pseudomonas putida]
MTDLIEVKTADLVGEQLAWAVGKAEVLDVILAPPIYGNPWRVFVRYTGEVIVHDARFDPHENWAVGGPLIDKHHGSTQHFHGLAEDACYSGGPAGAEAWSYGPTALVAFCRGFVHYKLGDTVQVPKELCP